MRKRQPDVSHAPKSRFVIDVLIIRPERMEGKSWLNLSCRFKKIALIDDTRRLFKIVEY